MGSNAVMLLLQQIQNDAKVLQTQAEADLKAAVTCPYGVTRVAQNGEFGASGKVLSVSMASRYIYIYESYPKGPCFALSVDCDDRFYAQTTFGERYKLNWLSFF